MRRQLRSEVLKIRTTRWAVLLLLVVVTLTLLGTLVEGLARTVHELSGESAQRTMFSAAGSSAVLLATFAGLVIVTGEFRYGTIRPTLLVEPRRRVVLRAKLAAAAGMGAVVGVVAVAVCFGAGLAILAARDVGFALSGGHALTLSGGTLVAAALGGIVGVGVGTLIRNQAGAIIAVAVYAFAVDATVFAAVPSVGRYLPGKAGDALIGRPVAHLLSPAVGLGVLVAWALAFVVLAAVRSERVDI